MSSNEIKRTRDSAGANETADIKAIVSAIKTRSAAGLKIIQSFQEKFGLDILDARERKGNRGVHYDFEVLVGPEPGVWKHVEHKGSSTYTPILPDQTPWAAGVQFHNGGCEKYSIAKKYARHWYETYIGSGKLKTDWALDADVPTFEEWYVKDAKKQGDPATTFGKELKRKVRLARGAKSSLLEERRQVNETFIPCEDDLELFKTEALPILNSVLQEKDYWLTIHGSVGGDFHCAWYPSFQLREIKRITMEKELDIWFNFECEGCAFRCILRWGKGAGFSNIRIDARD